MTDLQEFNNLAEIKSKTGHLMSLRCDGKRCHGYTNGLESATLGGLAPAVFEARTKDRKTQDVLLLGSTFRQNHGACITIQRT